MRVKHFARLLAATACCALAAACSSGGSGFEPSMLAPPAALQRAAAAAPYGFAPYVDLTSWPPPQLATYAGATGGTYYTFAFAQSYQSKQCQAAWGGTVLPTDGTYGAYYRKQLAAVRALGGDGILGFGGAAGLDLASACATPADLANAIQAIVDYYHFTHVDFDIEGNQPYDAPAVARRSAALALVEKHYAALGSPIVVSYTLPVLPSGMPPHVLGVVRSALSAGVKVGIVNVMTMDYGDSVAPNPKGRMGAYAIQAAVSTRKQLAAIHFPFGTNPYAAIGITPMIGVNDVSDEIFMPSDASQLVAWASSHGIGRLAFWASQRDKQCPGGVKHYASDTCSGILQSPMAFGKIFAPF